MKIYFSGSVRGGTGDKELYAQIITILQEYGEVVSYHLGYGSDHKEHMTDEESCKRDKEKLESCEIVVAEVTTPSLGVGYEVATAEHTGKKVLCLFRETEGKKLSNMIRGNKNLTVVNYKSTEDLKGVFNIFFT